MTGIQTFAPAKDIGLLSLIGKPPVWPVILFTVILATWAHIVVA